MAISQRLMVGLFLCLALHAGLRWWVEIEHPVLAPRLQTKDDPNLIRDLTRPVPGGRTLKSSIPSHILKKMTFGYPNLTADFMWLRFIQGMDTLVVDVASKGWLYQLLDGIVTLDPKFRIAYSAGGLWLSAIRQDLEGATSILERGLTQFPDNWNLHLALLYHHLWETSDLERAREIAQKASALPDAPPFVGRLVGTLLSREGDYDAAISFLENLIKDADSDALRESYRERLMMTIVDRDTHQLKNLISQKMKNTFPKSWDEAIARGVVRDVPRDPKGDPYILNFEGRTITSRTIEVKSGLPQLKTDDTIKTQ